MEELTEKEKILLGLMFKMIEPILNACSLEIDFPMIINDVDLRELANKLGIDY